MNREIKEFLHLYLGCEGIADMTLYLKGKGKEYDLSAVPVIFDSINRNRAELTDGRIDQWVGLTMQCGERGILYYDVFDRLVNCYTHFIHPQYFKPLLRPLSDMTEEEMKELLCLDFAPSDDVFRNMVTEFKFDVNEPQRRTKRGTGVGFSVFKDGSHYMSGTLSFVDLNPHQFVYLLKLGFDLFGLIEAGLAIDKSKLTTPLSI